MFEAARSNSDTLFVAVDPVADQMAVAARKAVRQRLANVLFVQAAVGRLPPELDGLADRITINFPWGSLLKALAVPDAALLSAIARLGRPGAALTALINVSVFDDAAYCARQGLPCPPVFADGETTRWTYGQSGLDVTRIVQDAEVLPVRTTWGRKLTRGTRRRVLQLEAGIGSR